MANVLNLFLATVASLSAAAMAKDVPATPSARASVTLDQLTTSRDRPGAPNTAVDLDVNQQSPSAPAAKVTSAEVSTRAQGRTLTSDPIVGLDRCDGAERGARPGLCRRALEARAGDYTRPRAAPVTPEGRLLLLTNPSVAPGNDLTGRGAATTGLDAPNGPAEQLAGALQDRTAVQDGTASSPGSSSAGVGALPAGVPSIVVLPR